MQRKCLQQRDPLTHTEQLNPPHYTRCCWNQYLLDDRVCCGHRQRVAVVDCAGSFDLGGLCCLRSPSTPTGSPCWLRRASLLPILVCQAQNNWVLCSGCTHVCRSLSFKKSDQRDWDVIPFKLILRCPYHSPKQSSGYYYYFFFLQFVQQKTSFVKHLNVKTTQGLIHKFGK